MAGSTADRARLGPVAPGPQDHDGDRPPARAIELDEQDRLPASQVQGASRHPA
jgi:hypothetical protein